MALRALVAAAAALAATASPAAMAPSIALEPSLASTAASATSTSAAVAAASSGAAIESPNAVVATAAPAAPAPPPGGYPPWTAVRLWPNMTSVENAVCLDGSPPLYYVSPGWGDGADKWQIHHEGGAWCGGAADCLNWWGFRSTLVDPDTLPSDANANTGYFNRTEPQNSMANWNYVFIRYCDGWSFASNRAEPTVLPVTNASGSFNVTMHFRGLAVLEAVRRDLIKNGMGAATDVVVGGCSAGGLAVFLHCDEWADALHAVAPTMNVVCLADSGWCVQG